MLHPMTPQEEYSHVTGMKTKEQNRSRESVVTYPPLSFRSLRSSFNQRSRNPQRGENFKANTGKEPLLVNKVAQGYCSPLIFLAGKEYVVVGKLV